MTELERNRKIAEAAIRYEGDCYCMKSYLLELGIKHGDCNGCFYPKPGGICKKTDVIQFAQLWLTRHRGDQLELDFGQQLDLDFGKE